MPNDAIYPSLKDRVVLVTGGAMGIGEAIVRGFAAQGPDRISRHRRRGGAEAQADLRGQGTLHYEHCDVTDIAALRRAIENVRKALGPITILINNAAHDQRHKIAEVTPEFFDDRIAVNLKHQFFAAQAVYPDMKAAQNGAIVNFGSSAWMVGRPQPDDLFDRQGRRARVDPLARARVRPRQHPGQLRRAGLDHDAAPDRAVAHAGGRENLIQSQCIKRKLYPDDVARLVLFLASDDSSGCTNQSYIIDGGRN